MDDEFTSHILSPDDNRPLDV